MTTNSSSRIGPIPTLDLLLRQNAQRNGDALALIDAPDRPLWADGAPRRLNWSQVDAAVSAVAGRFFEMGLPSDAVVCIQGLNVTDTLIALMGCVRAGLVATIVPLDYTPVELVTLAESLNAKALLSARKMGPEQPLRPLRHLVDESIADIRFIGAFGPDLPGGTLSFEDCIGYPKSGAITRLLRRERPEDSLAIMTVDRGPGGDFAVARNHRQWHAAATLIVDELGLSRSSRLLSPMAPSSLAGLASGMVAWLIAGCQLALHQAFDATVFAVQMNMHATTHIVLPDAAVQAVAAEGLLTGRKLERVASLSREPHLSQALAQAPCPVSTYAVLGEIGLVPLQAGGDSRFKLPAAMAGEETDWHPVLETLVETGGQLALRGEHVALVGFDLGNGENSYPISPENWVSTGYPAIAVEDGVRITGARHGDASIAIPTQTPMLNTDEARPMQSATIQALAGAA